MSEQYQALVAKLATFCEHTSQRRADDLNCRRGCDACCQVWLSVSAVEAEPIREALAALPEAARAALAERGEREHGREQRADGTPPRCAMLADDGACVVYGARPLVCRSQGHALAYPHDVIPKSAVRASAGKRALTWCPLNYEAKPPAGEDVLDAERVDVMLALVNRKFCTEHDVDPHARVALSELARAPW